MDVCSWDNLPRYYMQIIIHFSSITYILDQRTPWENTSGQVHNVVSRQMVALWPNDEHISSVGLFRYIYMLYKCDKRLLSDSQSLEMQGCTCATLAVS